MHSGIMNHWFCAIPPLPSLQPLSSIMYPSFSSLQIAMSSHLALPPLQLPGAPNADTIRALQQKLMASEHDASQLMKNLSDIGFSHDVKANKGSRNGNKENNETIPPFKTHKIDPEVLQKNYEALVSRCCKTESTIQSIKLTLLRVQAERDLSKNDKASTQGKLTAASEAFEKEIKRLNRDVQNARKESEEAEKRYQESQANVKKLQEALEEADAAKVRSLSGASVSCL